MVNSENNIYLMHKTVVEIKWLLVVGSAKRQNLYNNDNAFYLFMFQYIYIKHNLVF